MASDRKTVSTSRMPFRSIVAAFFLCSFVRSARSAAKAVPSCSTAQTAPVRRTNLLASRLVQPKIVELFCCTSSSSQV